MMTLTSINAVINDERLNGNKAEIARAMQLLRCSHEFERLTNLSTSIGLTHLGLDPASNVSRMLEFVENVMALAVDIGYKIHKQEVGTRELEAFFGTTDEVAQGVRVDKNLPAEGEEVPGVRHSG